MGCRGPLRKPGSRRWKAEHKKEASLLTARPAGVSPINLADLPQCPARLPRSIADRWLSLLIDIVDAGVAVTQIDSRCIEIAARYEENIAQLDQLCARTDLEPETLMSALRAQQAAMREYLAALEKIGGTPMVRLRARIAPEEKTHPTDDPWANL